MARYEKTGVLEGYLKDNASRPMCFGDFSDIGDYHSVMSRVALLNSEFLRLPAKLRARFGNDAKQLLDYLSDSKNDVEAVKLGLKEQSVLPKPVVKPFEPVTVPAPEAPKPPA